MSAEGPGSTRAGFTESLAQRIGQLQAQAQVAAEGGGLVRLVDLQAGQRVQGTVLQLRANGEVLLGLLGGPVLASTNLTLEVGRSYDLTVSQTSPRVVLARATPLVVPTQTALASAGLLGPGGRELLPFQQAPGARSGGDAPGGGSRTSVGREAMQNLLAAMETGSASAKDLQSLHRHFGHDQEARVLRLPSRSQGAPVAGEVQALQQSYKAELLLRFAERITNPSGTEAEAQPLRQMLEGMTRIESDNAQRADQGLPQWLPLPVPAQAFLRDARMFLVRSEAETAKSASMKKAAGVTIVLLLDLSRLGAVRVDVTVQDDMVSAVFQATETSAVEVLSRGKEELQDMLAERGLRVSELVVRKSGATGLPVADLIRPPTEPEDATSLVDIHA